MTDKPGSGERRPGGHRGPIARALLDLSAVALVGVLPVLMVASNRSSAAVIAIAAALAAASMCVEQGVRTVLHTAARVCRQPAATAAIAFIAWGLTSVAWSVEPAASLGEWGALALPLASAVILGIAFSRRPPARAALAMTGGMFLAMLGIWIEVKYGYPLSRMLGTRQASTAFNRPTLTVVVLFWPLLALLRVRRRDLLALMMFMLVVMTASVSHSGAALAAIAVSTLAYGAIQVAPAASVRLALVALALALAAAPWIGAIVDRSVPSRVFDKLHEVPDHGFSARERLAIWKTYGAVSHRRFWTGTGFGSSRALSRDPVAKEIDPSLRADLRFPHPHDAFLQIWVETGVIGALLFALFLAALLRDAWRRPLGVPPPTFAVAVAIGLIAAISHGAWQAWWIAAIGAAAAVTRFDQRDAAPVDLYDTSPRGIAAVLSWSRHTLAIRALAFLHDVLLTGVAFMLALLLRLGLKRTLAHLPELWPATGLVMLIAAVSGPMFGLNSGVWRYASLPDLRGIVGTATTTIIFFLIAKLVIPSLEAVPRSVPLATWFVMIILLAGPRVAYRIWKSARPRSARAERQGRKLVLLVGAGDETDLFMREASGRNDFGYEVVGVIDERGRRIGQSIRGVPILGNIDDIPKLLTRLSWNDRRPTDFIITRNRATLAGDLVEKLLAVGQEHDIAVLRLPDVKDLRGTTALRLEPIAIDDLLYRDPAKLDLRAIDELVKGARLLVTGGGGSIGAELCRQLAALQPASLTIVDYAEPLLYEIDRQLRRDFAALEVCALIADVRDRAQVTRLFAEVAPDIVFHAAALKHVPIVEAQPREGLLTNAIGTRNVADAAVACGSRAMVMVSTDKAINPTSVMGASKRLAELYCQALDIEETTRFVTVRFGNVLGSAGSVVPLFRQQIAAGGPITITHPDMKRYFLTIPEAVQLVLQATNHGARERTERGAIFVLDMGSPVKITDLAEKMVRLAGLRIGEDIAIVFTGLRPGEKLFEEMFGIDEPPVPTTADGVLMAYPQVLSRPVIARIYDRFLALVEQAKEREAVELLMNTIPEYRPDERLLKRMGIEARQGTSAARAGDAAAHEAL